MCSYLTQFESEGTPKEIAIKMSIISVTYYFRFCFLKFLQREPFYENLITLYQ